MHESNAVRVPLSTVIITEKAHFDANFSFFLCENQLIPVFSAQNLSYNSTNEGYNYAKLQNAVVPITALDKTMCQAYIYIDYGSIEMEWVSAAVLF